MQHVHFAMFGLSTYHSETVRASSQDFALPLMEDPRFEEDTLFMVFEEDMRFEDDADDVETPCAVRQGLESVKGKGKDRKHGEL